MPPCDSQGRPVSAPPRYSTRYAGQEVFRNDDCSAAPDCPKRVEIGQDLIANLTDHGPTVWGASGFGRKANKDIYLARPSGGHTPIRENERLMYSKVGRSDTFVSSRVWGFRNCTKTCLGGRARLGVLERDSPRRAMPMETNVGSNLCKETTFRHELHLERVRSRAVLRNALRSLKPRTGCALSHPQRRSKNMEMLLFTFFRKMSLVDVWPNLTRSHLGRCWTDLGLVELGQVLVKQQSPI